MSLLKLLGVLPGLINAIELLFSGFPGKGAVKKAVVMKGVNEVAAAAAKKGVSTTGWEQTAAELIDSYVAVQNALSVFKHERNGV